MRLIDADALKKDIQEYFDGIPVYIPGVFHAIERALTIHARQGHWIFHEQKTCYLWKCSECGGNSDNRYAFCPFCGALMWGGGDKNAVD